MNIQQIFYFLYGRELENIGAFCSGITQNVEDMLQSHTARTMLANSELIIMLNQASTDRLELAKLLNISDLLMTYITNTNAGEGLIKIGSSLIPFVNKFPRNTELYSLMTTKLRRRKDLMKRILYILTILLLISVLLISSNAIFKELINNRKQENVLNEIKEIKEGSKQSNNNIKKEEHDLEQLYKMNDDFVGWIRIQDTNIDYPVMKSKTPNYYLRRNFYKEYSIYRYTLYSRKL